MMKVQMACEEKVFCKKIHSIIRSRVNEIILDSQIFWKIYTGTQNIITDNFTWIWQKSVLCGMNHRMR